MLFSADLKRADAVKDARHAIELAAEERLNLVVAMDTSEDDDDDDDDMDDDIEDEEIMEVDGNVTGMLWSILSVLSVGISDLDWIRSYIFKSTRCLLAYQAQVNNQYHCSCICNGTILLTSKLQQ